MLFGDAAKQFEQTILERHPDIDIIAVSVQDAVDKVRDDVSCVVGWRFSTEMFRQLPNLKWIQSISVGVDDWLPNSIISPEVIITNTKGLYADEVAEYVIWALITLSRNFDVAVRNQHKRRWQRVAGVSLTGKTIGIAGMGQVGRATARLARAFGMQIVGISRVADDQELDAIADEVVPVADLDSILGHLDALAICLPVTDRTRGLFDADAIAKLKRGAIVVNAAREDVVDYGSLADAVRQGHLAAAAMDVFEKEPLKKWSPHWKGHNLLITPHISGFTKGYKTKVANLICDNMDRFRSGRPLECVVDRAKGY